MKPTGIFLLAVSAKVKVDPWWDGVSAWIGDYSILIQELENSGEYRVILDFLCSEGFSTEAQKCGNRKLGNSKYGNRKTRK